MSKAIALSKNQIKTVLSGANLMTHSESKRCALALSHAAMRVSEIALLQTKTIVNPSGQIKEEIHLQLHQVKLLDIFLLQTKRKLKGIKRRLRLSVNSRQSQKQGKLKKIIEINL